MNYKKLNNHHLELSEICFGGASISGEGKGYGFGEISEIESIDLVLAAFDKGINFFDTAPIYGFNTSEDRLSIALKDIREKVTLVSKCGVDWHESKRVNMSNAPDICQKMLDNSLRRHQYLDIYMIHWPDKKVDIRYSLEVLQKAKENKDILHIGLCNTNQDELNKAQEVCEIDVLQSEVNMFNNEFEQLSSNAFKMGWGTFDKGILTGSVTKTRVFENDDCRSWAPWWNKSNWKEKVDKADELKAYSQSHGYELIDLALAYSLSDQGGDSAICGFKSVKQLEGILSSMNKNVSTDILVKGLEILG